MKLSEERILFLARESLTQIRDEGLAEIANFPLALRQARELIAQWNDKGCLLYTSPSPRDTR